MMRSFIVLICLSILVTRALGWQGSWPQIFLTQQQPTAYTPPWIPIDSNSFSSVTLSASITITNQNSNFSLLASLVTLNGTEYFFDAFDYEAGRGLAIPCTVAQFLSTNYSLHYFFIVEDEFQDIDISVTTIVNIDSNELHTNSYFYTTFLPYVYFRLDVPTNYSRYYATITVQAKENEAVPFTTLCLNSHTCPGSTADCFASYSINTTESSWNTTVSALSPGSYFLLLEPTKEFTSYQISAQLQRDDARGNLLLACYWMRHLHGSCCELLFPEEDYKASLYPSPFIVERPPSDSSVFINFYWRQRCRRLLVPTLQVGSVRTERRRE